VGEEEKGETMKILVTRRDGSQTTIQLLESVVVRECEGEQFTMAHFNSGDGFDHYFNKDDGTYDGWGAGCTSGEHAQMLIEHARGTEEGK